MHIPATLKISGLTAVIAAASAAMSPAMAGRCGHSYAVDEPTTLTEVARRCNVSLSALYEANPGVNPNNVRPGEHLAVPDEIGAFAPRAVSLTSDSETVQAGRAAEPSAHPYIVSSDYRRTVTDDSGLGGYQPVSDRVEIARTSQRARFRSNDFSSNSPVWLREETPALSHHSSSDRLSYQKLSAMRIRTAGVPSEPVYINPVTQVSTPLTATMSPQLIECPVLRKSDGGKIHKVRKIISTPENTFVQIDPLSSGDGFDCTLIAAPKPVALDPGRAGGAFQRC